MENKKKDESKITISDDDSTTETEKNNLTNQTSQFNVDIQQEESEKDNIVQEETIVKQIGDKTTYLQNELFDLTTKMDISGGSHPFSEITDYVIGYRQEQTPGPGRLGGTVITSFFDRKGNYSLQYNYYYKIGQIFIHLVIS